MRKLNSKLETEFISEKGNDSIHKTYVAYTPLDQYMCIVIGESYDNDVDINSAKLAVQTVLTAFERKPSLKRLKEYVKHANEQILLHSTKNKLKVSVTVLVTDYTRMQYAVCGNTKIHVFNENVILHESITQTKWNELIESNRIEDIDPAEVHNLTKYLGMSNKIKPFISGKIDLIENSTIFLSSSNIWGQIASIELLDAYENAKESEELLDSVQELLLSRQEEGQIGSYTAAAIFVKKTYKEDSMKKKKRKKLFLIVSIVLIAIILIGFILILLMRSNDRKKINEINKLKNSGTKYITYGNYSKSLIEYEKAAELTDTLNMNNWQYTEDKKEIADLVSEKVTLLTTIQDAESFLKEKNYEDAKKLFSDVLEQARYDDETSISQYAEEKLDLVNSQLEISNLIAIGEMYEASEDYENALDQYNQAIEVLKQIKDVELRSEVQVKIYDVTQKLKEIEQAKEDEKEQKKQEKANKKLIKIRVLLASANKALGEGKVQEAENVHDEILSVYNEISISNEEVEKIYEDIVTLEQAISEEKVKQSENAVNEKIEEAGIYIMDAAEAARKNQNEKAIKLYEKALAVYKELKIWDSQVEKIYEEINILEQAIIEASEPVSSTPEEEEEIKGDSEEPVSDQDESNQSEE